METLFMNVSMVKALILTSEAMFDGALSGIQYIEAVKMCENVAR